QEEITDLDSQIATGQMGSLLDWLREKIHRQGSLHEPVPLITRATGSTPDSAHLLNYLESKYTALYNL
ncbi:MAG TPA: carboxypeptidase M32, partial [Acidobacteriota bacterium]|nr:carboxypeptidase M32 [Acidobacteriota bacterium]